MANNHCPECGNLVAYSAKKCPQCGNRNFISQTDSFVDVCKTCEGSGRHYFHVDHRIREEDCKICSGRGYAYRSYRHDCRDFHEWDRLWNLARRQARENNKIITAIENQEYNEVFAERDGRIRSDAKRAADFRYRGDAIMKAKFELDHKRSDAWKAFWHGFKAVFAVWLVVSLGGCFLRVALNGGNSPADVHSSAFTAYLTAPFSSFFLEGILAGAAAVFLNAAGLAGRLGWARLKHDWIMQTVNFDNMKNIDYR
jgi:hypothetical protein